jgi:hypothetical protein
MSSKYVTVYRTNGQLMAESICIFLEAHGIKAKGKQESAGTVYGFTVGPLGEVPISVPEEKAQEAIDLLQAMENGEFVVPDDENNETIEGDSPENELPD